MWDVLFSYWKAQSIQAKCKSTDPLSAGSRNLFKKVTGELAETCEGKTNTGPAVLQYTSQINVATERADSLNISTSKPDKSQQTKTH
jgi:hypothetical protein